MAGEFDLIRDYFQGATATRTDVMLGIGDDCALLRVPPGAACTHRCAVPAIACLARVGMPDPI